MLLIDFDQISKLCITPRECIDWVYDAFVAKGDSENIFPYKTIMRMHGPIFFNMMPSYLARQGRVGMKVVSRHLNEQPALKADFLLYDVERGAALAFMDATWITAMRTGAAAALASVRLANTHKEFLNIGFVGLGNTARATMLCVRELYKGPIHVHLFKYKNQGNLFVERFSDMADVTFHIVDDKRQLLKDLDILFSCVTTPFDESFAPDDYFPKGLVLVPIQSTGFQNCDLFFDKIYGDDTRWVSNFRYFDRFRYYAEFTDVLTRRDEGRTSEDERIIVYFCALSLHDLMYASHIYDKVLKSSPSYVVDLQCGVNKFWA